MGKLGGRRARAARATVAGDRGYRTRRRPPMAGRDGRLAAAVAAISMAWATVAVVVMALVPVPATAATAGNNCLRRLVSHRAEFDRCGIDTTCFLFIEEDPFIFIGNISNDPVDPLNPRTPFPCTEFAERGLSGFSFSLYKKLWPSSPDLCVYAGDIDDCTFNGMIEYMNETRTPGHPGYGMALGVTGALVFSPLRRRLGISSSSILEDRLVVVRRKQLRAGFWAHSNFELTTLSWPFTTGTWVLILQAFLAALLITAGLSVWRPTPLWDVGIEGGGVRWRVRWLQWAYNWVRNLAGGELEPAEAHFEPARNLVRSVPFVVIAIVVVWWEAAFIIGSTSTTLTKPLSGLTDAELCSFTVPHNTALEETWLSIVNSGRESNPIDISGLATGTTHRTWNTCDSAAICFRQVTTGDRSPSPRCDSARTTDVLVTFRPVLFSQMRQHPELCDALEVVATEEEVFRFALGWMFADVVTPNTTAAAAWASRREDIDVAIRQARLDQTTNNMLHATIGKQVPCLLNQQRVQPGQLMLPLVLALAVYYVLAVMLALGYPLVQGALWEEKRRLV